MASPIKYQFRSPLMEGKYRIFIISQLALRTRMSVIYRMLTDANAWEKYGFAPYKGCYGNLVRRIQVLKSKQEGRDEIKAEYDRVMEDMSHIPLVKKRERLEEFYKLYKAYKKDDDRRGMIRILDKIKDHVGDETTLLATAIRDSGKTDVTVVVNNELDLKKELLAQIKSDNKQKNNRVKGLLE